MFELKEVLIFLSPVILAILVYTLWPKRKKLSPLDIQSYIIRIKSTQNLAPAHAVMECHKIFISALSIIITDKNCTAAQKIKPLAQRFSQINDIWFLHRLRNKIAHEMNIEVGPHNAKKARSVFIQAISELA